MSSFGQQLFQGCRWLIVVVKCRQNGSMTAMADDTESAADMPTPTGKERRSSLMALPRDHCPRCADHPPTGLHHIITGGHGGVCIACTPPDALPLPGILYKRHPQQPGDRGPASSTYTWSCGCQILEIFRCPRRGSTYM